MHLKLKLAATATAILVLVALAFKVGRPKYENRSREATASGIL